jgi:hypothetical protein
MFECASCTINRSLRNRPTPEAATLDHHLKQHNGLRDKYHKHIPPSNPERYKAET